MVQHLWSLGIVRTNGTTDPNDPEASSEMSLTLSHSLCPLFPTWPRRRALASMSQDPAPYD